jgi:hypothetical protein
MARDGWWWCVLAPWHHVVGLYDGAQQVPLLMYCRGLLKLTNSLQQLQPTGRCR